MQVRVARASAVASFLPPAAPPSAGQAQEQIVFSTANKVELAATRKNEAPRAGSGADDALSVAPVWKLFSHDGRTLAIWIANAAWGVGMLWFAWRRLRAFARLACLRRSLAAWPSRAAIRDEAEICRQLGLERLPPIMLSELAPMPLVLGTWRPVVVLPRSLAETATAEKLRALSGVQTDQPVTFLGSSRA